MDLYEIIEIYNPPHPMDVVKLIAKHYNRDLKSATVILIVDGMQHLMENKDYGLKSTIAGPIYGALSYSKRDLVYLPVASLQSLNYQQGDSLVPVFKNDEITNTLVKDCGGHGRALEVLNDCLAGRSIE
ncbi:hypothetical protein RhiirB3_430949 [Rhizophagus irregularis]|nr:hypothetical protein RhiirB3_430949 [Rhizophagus irregularis]